MTLREQLADVLANVKSLADTVQNENREFTDEEVTKITGLKAQADELETKVKAADEAQANMKSLLARASEPAEKSAERPEIRDRVPEGAKSFGEAFVQSEPYQRLLKSNPGGLNGSANINIEKVVVGEKGRGFKADPSPLSTDIAHLQPTRLPTVDLTYQQPLTLLDLISHGTVTGNSFEYVQITAVARNAAIVPNEIGPTDTTLKPLSDLSTALATGKVFTYADGYTVHNDTLADAGAFASYLNNQLTYNIRSVVENYVINGSGEGGDPVGILHTSGIQQIATAGTSPVQIPVSVRKAFTALSAVGANITGIVLNPVDAETLDLMQDGQGRFFGAGPFGSGPRTLWGRPYVTAPSIPEGTALVGDLSTINYLEREPLSVLAFNQHADYARRNLVYVRAETRGAQVIYKPGHLALVDLGTSGS